MKKNKKKLLVLTLLLFVAIGAVGFGAYSYYYTEGEIENETGYGDNIITITGTFNPTTDAAITSGDTGASSFLGYGGTISLNCPETTGGHETITCTGSVTVRNEGNTAIGVSYYDASASATSSETTVSAETPNLSWGNGSDYKEISGGSSETLSISVDVNVGSSSSISYDEAEYVSSPVSSDTLEASVYFRLNATQINY